MIEKTVECHCYVCIFVSVKLCDVKGMLIDFILLNLQ